MTEDVSFRILTFDLVDQAPPSRPVERFRDYCTVRMLGKTMDGRNVAVWAEGFHPYFFLQCPEDWQEYQVGDLKDFILSNGFNMENNLVDCVLQKSHRTFGFSDGQLFPFVKLSFRSVRAMNKCQNLFAQPITIAPEGDEDRRPQFFKVCEYKGVPSILKSIHDTNIQPAGWVKIPAGTYRVVANESDTDLNIHTKISTIVPFESDDIPRFIEMSFDGEMVSESWAFPQATRPNDSIVQLGVQLAYSDDLENPFCKVLFCLDEMGDLSEDGVEVRCFKDECDLMMDFRNWVIRQNPDIITGYNINRFDLPYLLKRATTLKLPKEFFMLGRYLREQTSLHMSYKSKQNKEKKVQYDVPIFGGRRIEDAYKSVKDLQKKLPSYTLEHVAQFYLGVGKHDVEHEDIFRAYQNTTDELSAKSLQGAVQRFLTEVRIMLTFATISTGLNSPNNLDGSRVSLNTVVDQICQKWPPEFAGQILASWNQAWSDMGLEEDRITSDLTDRQATEILEAYVNIRLRGSTLVFGSLFIDLNAQWMNPDFGISILHFSGGFISDPAVSVLTPVRPSGEGGEKRRRESSSSIISGMAEIRGLQKQDGLYEKMFKLWESRIQAEADVLDFVIAHHVPRKFAEKWWILKQEVDTGRTTSSAGSGAGLPLTTEQRAYGSGVLAEKIQKEREWSLAEKTRVGRYCMQDAALPLRLRKKHQFLISLMEMSQVTRVPPNMLIEKGQTIKVINLKVQWARENNYVVTVESIPHVHFKGGQVLVPKKKWYRDRVFTLDFASLYPSLMQSHVLCYSTFVLPRDIEAKRWANRADLQIDPINIGAPSNVEYQWVTNAKRTILPEILKRLVDGRRAVKKLLEAADTDQQRVIYNQRQLALKLVCNSVYGFTGYEFSPWPCLPIAVCTTVKGREAINTTKRMAEERYNANVIYGDSVTGETPILIRARTKSGKYVVKYWTIEAFFNFVSQNAGHLETVETGYHGHKESVIPRGSGGSDGDSSDFEVWSDRGFTKVKRVISHATNKKIYRVQTATGIVHVTEDHSLLKPDGTEVRPSDLVVGSPLMHANLPEDIPCRQYFDALRVHKVGKHGLFGPFAPWIISDAEMAADAFAYLEQKGYFPAVDFDPLQNSYIIRPRAYRTSDDRRVLSITPITPIGGAVEGVKTYVYDLETENHHFAAGVGKMVVHNTDSIMAIVPIPDHLTTDVDRMEYVFKIAKEAADWISTAFTDPMKLEFEKVYYPYLLVSKKRYSGRKWTKIDRCDGIDTKGIEAVRRDNCPLLRDTVIGALKILGMEMDVGKAIKYARRAFAKLAKQTATWEELTISKGLGENYKNPQIHAQVAKYLEEHHPLLAPEVGDRVPFVVIKKPGETRVTKAYEKGFNPVLAEREGYEPDWWHYTFKCLKKPIDRIFCIALGFEYKKDSEVQPTDYLWKPFLEDICKNDKFQTARVNGNQRLDTFFTPVAGTVPKRSRPGAAGQDELGLEDQVPEKPKTPPKKTTMPNSDIRNMFNSAATARRK